MATEKVRKIPKRTLLARKHKKTHKKSLVNKQFNKSRISLLKNLSNKILRSKEHAEASLLFLKLQKHVDINSRKGILPMNRASRIKSRLNKAVKNLSVETAA